MNTADAHYKKMTETSVVKLIILLGIPTTISVLVTNIYNLVDTYFVGTLGESPQGAIGILFTLQAIIQAFSFMLGHGSGTHVAKALADKNIKEASKYISSAFFAGALVGLLLMVFGLIFIEPFVYLLGSTDTILPYAKEYGYWVLLTAPFMVCSLVLNNNLRYEGKALYAMVGLVSGAVLNILGDYIFINVLDLGIFGAGMSTGISQIISFTILLIMYIKMAQSKISFKYISKSYLDYFNICRVGLPSLLRQGLISISHGILNNLANPFGDAAIAAISVVNRFNNLVICVALGIGQGFQPVASFNYQAKQYNRVKIGMLTALVIGVGSVFIFSLFGLIIPRQIIGIFQDSKEVKDIGEYGLRVASIGVIFSPISITVNMLYQSIRKSAIASILALLRSGLVLIPTLILFTNIWDLKGVLWAQPISDIVVAIISIPFILHFLFKTPNTQKEHNVVQNN